MAKYEKVESFDAKLKAICPHCKSESEQAVKFGVEINAKFGGIDSVELHTGDITCPLCKETFRAEGSTGRIVPERINENRVELKVE
jgi:Zn finger protein HypA/HybF involved in hydrogenase expression